MTQDRPGVERPTATIDTSTAPTPSPLYQMLVESARDYAIFALDTTGHVLTWNTGAENLKGYTRDEVVGLHFSVFYPPEDIAAGKPERELATAERDGSVEDEGWRIRKDGRAVLGQRDHHCHA